MNVDVHPVNQNCGKIWVGAELIAVWKSLTQMKMQIKTEMQWEMERETKK